ncbi:MAG TPA: elongation factor G [Caulobacteraceae bacterium]
MSVHNPDVVRAVALVGPTGVGKTSLMEAMLLAAGTVERRANGGLSEVIGDTSPEARTFGQSVELNLAGFDFLGDRYAIIDCPGSVDFAADGDFALAAVDLAVVVADPDPAKAVLLQPTLKTLERLAVPRILFVNKIDQARASLSELLTALGAVCGAPVVARQLPIWEGGRITGYVDLTLERAFEYREGQPSRRIDLPPAVADEEPDARFHMLEQLADFDDQLLEQLLSDQTPDQAAVFTDLVHEMNEGLIAPAFFGAASHGFGIRRLLKAFRHEIAAPKAAQARLGAPGPSAYVFKTTYAGQAGMLAYTRALGGPIRDGSEFTTPNGERSRAGGLFLVQGPTLKKVTTADEGEVVAIGKLEHFRAGDLLTVNGGPQGRPVPISPRTPVYWMAISAKARNDDVRLSGALAKLMDEDRALSLTRDPETHQTLLGGQGEGHLRLALDRLRNRFGLEVTTASPATPYKETISHRVEQHARHRKQTGGHGQFADLTIEVRALPRGEGFAFAQHITGGVVPKQWIPAVEQGVCDAMAKGPLGFPVTDVAVTLTDGAYHSVDSSEMAFRTAGRIGMEEALRRAGSCLLEPIDRLAVDLPSSCTSNAISALSTRRGQVLGFEPRPDWPGWDHIEATLPQAERYDLIGELRSLSRGLATFEYTFDHMSELSGRMAEELTQKTRA